MEKLTLKDLKGKHVLTAVSRDEIEFKDCCGDLETAQRFSFILDDITYTAIEDPQDGYRSCMDKIFISNIKLRNKFIGVKVVGRYLDKNDDQSSNILELIDIENGEVILRVGTNNTSDYYPYFVNEWMPEKMNINIK